MNKKIYFSLSAGTLVSIATLYLAFRNVPLTELAAYLSSINYFWILPTMLIILISFALRAVRWRYILASTQPVGFLSAYHPLVIGFMINCILPGRVGEFARPLILNHKSRIPVTTGLATVIVERVFDLIILLSLFMLVSNQIQIGAAHEIEFSGYRLDGQTLQSVFKGMLTASAVLIACIILLSLNKIRASLSRLVLALPALLFMTGAQFKRKFATKVCVPITKSIENMSNGMALMKDPVRAGVCLVISLAIWLVAALSYYVFSIGCPAIRLNPMEMTAVMIIICFIIALPSVPGFWGLWEAGGVFALAFFGVSETDAAGFTLANHAVQVIPVIIIGLLSAWISGVNIVKVSYQKNEVT